MSAFDPHNRLVGSIREVLVAGSVPSARDQVIDELESSFAQRDFAVRVERGGARAFAEFAQRWKSGEAPDENTAEALIEVYRTQRRLAQVSMAEGKRAGVIIHDGSSLDPLAYFDPAMAEKVLAHALANPHGNIASELRTYGGAAYVGGGSTRERELYCDASVCRPIVGDSPRNFARRIVDEVLRVEPIKEQTLRHTHAPVGVVESPGVHSAFTLLSARNVGEPHLTAVRTVGRRLAERGLTQVSGGGTVGFMGEIVDAVRAAGGTTIGVTTFEIDAREGRDTVAKRYEVHSDDRRYTIREKVRGAEAGSQSLVVTRSMLERNWFFPQFADVALWLPGGIGSLFEASAWAQFTQLGFQNKICGVLDVEGCYKHIQAHFADQVERGFISQAEVDNMFYFGAYDPLRPDESVDEFLDQVISRNLALQARLGTAPAGLPDHAL